MTLEEAKKVARVVGYADSGCSCCVEALVEKLNELFPEFVWSVGEDDEDLDWNCANVEVKEKK